MEITFDPEADALYIRLRKGTYSDSVEVAAGVTLDVDADERALGIEIMPATRLVDGDPASVNIKVARRNPADASAARVDVPAQ